MRAPRADKWAAAGDCERRPVTPLRSITVAESSGRPGSLSPQLIPAILAGTISCSERRLLSDYINLGADVSPVTGRGRRSLAGRTPSNLRSEHLALS